MFEILESEILILDKIWIKFFKNVSMDVLEKSLILNLKVICLDLVIISEFYNEMDVEYFYIDLL